MNNQDLSKQTVINFNELLKDIYKKEMRISQILENNGLKGDRIKLLKTNMNTLFEYIDFALKCKFIGYSNGKRFHQIICRRYGLFGCQKETLQAIGDDMGISRERVRQLEEKAIKRLKPNSRYDTFAVIITISACQVLNIDPIQTMNNDDFDDEGGDNNAE